MVKSLVPVLKWPCLCFCGVAVCCNRVFRTLALSLGFSPSAFFVDFECVIDTAWRTSHGEARTQWSGQHRWDFCDLTTMSCWKVNSNTSANAHPSQSRVQPQHQMRMSNFREPLTGVDVSNGDTISLLCFRNMDDDRGNEEATVALKI